MSDPSRRMRLAGVDIGTLTCRLLMADLPPKSLSDTDLSTAANDPTTICVVLGPKKSSM